MVLSVVTCLDSTFNVYARDKQVPKSCALLEEFAACSSSSSNVSTLLRTDDHMILCPGNAEEVYVINCQKRGGEVKGGRGAGETIVYINNSVVIHHQGQCYSHTVRRVDCDINMYSVTFHGLGLMFFLFLSCTSFQISLSILW